MNTKTNTDLNLSTPRSLAWIFGSGIGPRIHLEAETGAGSASAEATTGEGTTAGSESGANAGASEESKTPKNEGNKPSDKEAELIKENMKKKEKIQALESQLKAFEGIDPDAVKQLLADKAAADEAKKAAELEAAKAAGDFDKVKQMMADAHKAELEAERAKATTASDALAAAYKQINDLTVGTAFAQSNFVKDELVLPSAKARQLYGAHFESENGAVVAYDKPAGAGDRTRLVDGSGNPLGFEAALKKLVDSDPDRDNLVRSKVASGAGSTTTDAKPAQGKQPELKGVARIQAALSKQTK